MSAYIVDKVSIDILVAAGIEFGEYNGIAWNGCDNPSMWDTQRCNHTTADRVGRMLWAENLASVAYRYPNDASGERPGPVGFEDSDVEAYRWERIPGFITPLPVLSLIDSYEYQSCEHFGWHNSEAKRFCDALRKAAIRRIPGYAALPGEISDRNYFVTRRVTK